jgi:hypothetical protein
VVLLARAVEGHELVTASAERGAPRSRGALKVYRKSSQSDPRQICPRQIRGRSAAGVLVRLMRYRAGSLDA